MKPLMAALIRKRAAWRLNPDGTLDTTFNPSTHGFTYCMVVQPDGAILVGGDAIGSDISQGSALVRFHPDGSLDEGFKAAIPYPGLVFSIALQANGKMIIGGHLTDVSGVSRTNLARLDPDGSLDPTFNPGVGSDSWEVDSLALQADGNVVVTGPFTTLAGQKSFDSGRLLNNEPAVQYLTFDGSTVSWTRGGSAPEVWRATFEYSPDGISWTNLGEATREPGGWEMTWLSLPATGRIRARLHNRGIW